MDVSLTPSEMMQAAHVGIMRQVQNLKCDRRPAYGAGDDNDWQYHIEGALGEFAFAKLAGIFWNGNLGQLDLSDVANYEVRTRSRSHYDLILHPKDDDTKVFILLTGRNGRYRVHGWIRGADGKRDVYWRDPAKGRPAFFVPQSALNGMDTLLNVPLD